MTVRRRKQPVTVVRQPSVRGWAGPGGGESTVIQAPVEFRGTSVQVCGLWPFAAGTGTPLIGVPIGRNLLSGATLCCDPISWFQPGAYISNPSQMILGLPGYGKSSLIKRMLMGSAAFGRIPLILGDTRPDYVDLIEALGGQVIRIGRGRGYLNILDPGDTRTAAQKLSGQQRHELLADAHARRLTMVLSLIGLARGEPANERETNVIDAALRLLTERVTERTPVLPDLLELVEQAPEALRHAAMARGDSNRYQDLTEGLVVSLRGLLGQGRLGEIFSRESTVQMRRDRPAVFDVSSIGDGDTDLQGAALLACWSTGFASVNIAHLLADQGLEPRRYFDVVGDEFWRPLRAAEGMVDRADRMTRLNREGYSVTFCTHTLSDFDALPREEDRVKARGFVERVGIVHMAALPPSELARVTAVLPLSVAEQQLVTSWPAPPSFSENARPEPPGRGRFLLKVAGRPGIPYRVQLTPNELDLSDTNKRWSEAMHASSSTKRKGDE